MAHDQRDTSAGEMGSEPLRRRVITIVAEALDVPADQVRMHSSLIDDLGAESIDFLDIQFRIETAFAIVISEAELWAGSASGTDQASIDRAVDSLRARMPDFRWDRLPSRLARQDLPRLITPQTIVDYLERHGLSAARPS
jgi:acyl carrier protein